jgi:hypothetical protein
VQFSGKITLPSEYNGKPVVGISGFNRQTNLTHIYWHGTPKLEIVNSNCFGSSSSSIPALTKLQVVQLPDTVKFIGQYAFKGCSGLKPVDLSKLTKLERIETFAFAASMTYSGEYPHFKIPGSVVFIGATALAYLGIPIALMSFGGPGDPSQLTTIGTNATAYNSTAKIRQIHVYGLDDATVNSWKSNGRLTASEGVTRIDA